MKKVLVTGCTGFIGNHVVKQLLQNGCEVVATSAHETKARQFDWFRQVKYIPFDLQADNVMHNYFELFDRPDALIHLAWEGLPNYRSLFHFEENLPAHYRFLKQLVTEGLTDITVTGTCFEYGMQEGALREVDQALPANPYALAKDTLRKFLAELQKHQPFVFKWVRLFYLYGPGQHPNSLLSQLEKALETGAPDFKMSGGEQVRDYLPVEQVAGNIVKIALQRRVTGIVNCCSGIPITVKQLVERYLQERGRTIPLTLGYYPYPDYEPMKFWGDNAKLKIILNNEQPA
jgi:dTDP-6-deoxy-L-talose 4-dehydrogenase (NAD+)